MELKNELNDHIEYYIWDDCPQELFGQIGQTQARRHEYGHYCNDVSGVAARPVTPVEHPSVGGVRMGPEEGAQRVK